MFWWEEICEMGKKVWKKAAEWTRFDPGCNRRFTCNICQMVNEVPMEYFCSLDAQGRRLDAAERPELSCGSVDWLAPQEYMVSVWHLK